MTPRTVPIICAKRPVRSGCVPAVRGLIELEGARTGGSGTTLRRRFDRKPSGSVSPWRCSFCGKRVKVVA